MSALKFYPVLQDFQKTDGTKQFQQLFTNMNTKLTAKHLKINIEKGFDHFVAVYHLKVIGSSGNDSPAKFSALQMGIGRGEESNGKADEGPPATGGIPTIRSSGAKFGSSFSTQPINMENRFSNEEEYYGENKASKFSKPNNNVEPVNWNLDEMPIPTAKSNWDSGENKDESDSSEEDQVFREDTEDQNFSNAESSIQRFIQEDDRSDTESNVIQWQ